VSRIWSRDKESFCGELMAVVVNYIMMMEDGDWSYRTDILKQREKMI